MRYLIKWTKEGMMKYISHLDMMRLFQRALKRAGIKLLYSQGFSPHPKMSIAQPLSLGYTSRGEYLEFETAEEFPPQEIGDRLDKALPAGISVVSCGSLTETRKAVGALVAYGEYEITFPHCSDSERAAIITAAEQFVRAEHIYLDKLQKKSGKIQQVDIRPMIFAFEAAERGDVLRAVICTGSRLHLNPDLLLRGFETFLPETERPEQCEVERKEMYTQQPDGTLMALERLK